MSEIFQRVLHLVRQGDVRISDHGYNELMADGIFTRDLFLSILDGIEIENYPEYLKGPCVLVLQKDRDEKPVHVVWGIPEGKSSPAVLVTAYRPDPKKWTDDYLRRRR